jgi:hypothetical protein
MEITVTNESLQEEGGVTFDPCQDVTATGVFIDSVSLPRLARWGQSYSVFDERVRGRGEAGSAVPGRQIGM